MDRARVVFAVALLVGLLVLASCGTAGTPTAAGGGVVVGTSSAAATAPAATIATASPAATPAVATPGPQGLTVTPAQDGQTVELAVGQVFLLKLGSDYQWTVQVADTTVLSRIPNVMVVQGAQGIYAARAVGQTTLTATGDPLCRQASPPCAMPSRSFHVTVLVRPAAATATP